MCTQKALLIAWAHEDLCRKKWVLQGQDFAERFVVAVITMYKSYLRLLILCLLLYGMCMGSAEELHQTLDELVVEAGSTVTYTVSEDDFKLVVSPKGTYGLDNTKTGTEAENGVKEELEIEMDSQGDRPETFYFSMAEMQNWMHFDIPSKVLTALPPISLFSNSLGSGLTEFNFIPKVIVQSPYTNRVLTVNLPVKVVKYRQDSFSGMYL